MLKNIYFHIGTAKTATTLIQKALWDNREILKQFDTTYLDIAPPKLEWGRYANIEFLIDPNINISTENLRHYLNNLGTSNLIISEEGLWTNSLENINHPAFENYNKIIILYVRRPAEIIASWASEVSKPYNELQKLHAFEGGLLPIDKGLIRLTEYYIQIFDRLFSFTEKNALPKIIVRPFENSQLKNNNIFCDFIETLQIDSDQFFKSKGIRLPESENAGKSRKYCDISSHTLQILKAEKLRNKFDTNLVDYIYENCESGDNRSVLETLSDECIIDISEKLQYIEDEISRRFLSGKKLFNTRLPPIYKKKRDPHKKINPEEVEKLLYKYLWIQSEDSILKITKRTKDRKKKILNRKLRGITRFLRGK